MTVRETGGGRRGGQPGQYAVRGVTIAFLGSVYAEQSAGGRPAGDPATVGPAGDTDDTAGGTAGFRRPDNRSSGAALSLRKKNLDHHPRRNRGRRRRIRVHLLLRYSAVPVQRLVLCQQQQRESGRHVAHVLRVGDLRRAEPGRHLHRHPDVDSDDRGGHRGGGRRLYLHPARQYDLRLGRQLDRDLPGYGDQFRPLRGRARSRPSSPRESPRSSRAATSALCSTRSWPAGEARRATPGTRCSGHFWAFCFPWPS